MGVSGAQADMLLMKREAEDFFDEDKIFGEGGLFEDHLLKEILEGDRTADALETGFFLMTDDEKFDFLLDKGPDYVELVQDYVMELAEKEEFEKIQDFYQKFNEKYKDFFPLHFIMGTIFVERDPKLGKFYFEETLKAVEKYDELPNKLKNEIKQDLDSLTKYLVEEPTEKPEEKVRSSKKGKRKGASVKKASNQDDEI